MRGILLIIGLVFWVCKVSFAQHKSFVPGAVKLEPGLFKNAQDVDVQYILALNPDKLLAPYLLDAGLPIKAERYGNWESSGLDGHIGGHYLSALAMMYATTSNAELKQRLDYMVAELARCQQKNVDGYVGGIPNGKVFWNRIKQGDIDGSSFGLNNTWVPLYNIHKLYAGLHDAYFLGGNTEALTVLIGLSDWMIDLFKNLSDEQTEQVLKTEHGGLNESFLEVYLLTKEKKYLDFAERLSQKFFLNPLLNKEDKLTGLHANTQIPKVVGFERISQVTGNTAWHEASAFFWDNVANHRSVAFGGNSYREHFHELERFDKMLETNQGPETCNSYNMLKLSKALFLNTGDLKYLDFYEKTMFNHILSSQHPEKGGFVYFTPIRPNHYRVYSQPETSMWCCVGTGLENHAKYGELIYTHQENQLSINLLVASVVQWNGLILSQSTHFPYENRAVFSVEAKENVKGAFRFRVPSWMKSPQLLVNGKKHKASMEEGYLTIARKWKNNDEIIFTFDASVTQESLPSHSQWTAFKYGPIVLAQETSKENLTGLFADDSRMGHETRGKMYPLYSGHVFVSEDQKIADKIIKGDGLTFSIDSLTLKPFFAIHESRYQMYFQVLSEQENAKLIQQKQEQSAFEERIVDKIDLGEQQPEADHGYRGEKSNSGYDHGSFWRNTAGYISYQMLNKGKKGTRLYIYSLDKITDQNLGVYINAERKTIQIDTENKAFVDVSNLESIEIRIQPAEVDNRTPRLTKIIIN
jgi:DUF1680 family protein